MLAMLYSSIEELKMYILGNSNSVVVVSGSEVVENGNENVFGGAF